MTATGNISFTAQYSSDNSSLTGQAAGSLVGVGGAVSYNVIADQVRAYVQSSTVVSNSGEVSIIAVLTATINTITVGLSGGFVGIAGSVAVNLLGSSVSAPISPLVGHRPFAGTGQATATDQMQAVAGSVAGGRSRPPAPWSSTT